MTTKLIPFMPVTNRMKARDRRQLRIEWIFKNDDCYVIRWHVYDAHYKWQLTDPGPSLISRPIPTAFLLLPSFILQPMKLSIFSQKLPLRGWLVWNRISLRFGSFHAHVLWATVSFHLLTVDISICHCSNTTTIPLPNSCFLLRGQAATKSNKHETSCDYLTFDWRYFHCHCHFASP